MSRRSASCTSGRSARPPLLAEQLQGALSSRVVIEQAKGVVAYTNGVTIEQAFELIRRYARSHQLGISQVAARLVDRSLRLDG